ncbi:hypothetical protein RHMOL_Rhmol09G0251900 [Rhododendron molle]|uniref:Uncharacterized protein n=1 Tax=Rhododendron molle TaxID=49168 RepID=A0ACC0MJ07_RHOML|nr:hypothetical protein RHMOL_Rhmol09G0251900 [Rhododendron molle]
MNLSNSPPDAAPNWFLRMGQPQGLFTVHGSQTCDFEMRHHLSSGLHPNSIEARKGNPRTPTPVGSNRVDRDPGPGRDNEANMLKLTNMKGLKPMEYGALKDCLDQVADTVVRLSRSAREIEELGQAQGGDFSWHKSNVETWTNEALNQVRACAGGFLGQTLDGKIKDSVQAQTTKVRGLISMVLELVRQFEGKKLNH